ncbi:MAG: aspartate kinase [Oscillospiraceae bacterium]|nr:aspartate kinase [Oscillospiraceae bacterium]
MSTIVAKFGGSSLADANQFKKVADIVKSDPNRRYVIPSAPGKRSSEDEKVTDMLYACYAKARKGESFDADFAAICARYQGIIDDLGLTLDLSDEFSYIQTAFKRKAGKAYAASRGEYLCGIVLAAYLDFDFVDAARVICFDDNGEFNVKETKATLQNILANYEYAVIPGFYGSTPEDNIVTFSRGGSDITGALVAQGVEADLYENWTDVPGFLAADPRIVDSPDRIDVITYRELRELSYMGATVLHEDTIFPVYVSGIAIHIRNTNDVSAKGTLIVADAPPSEDSRPVTGIAGRKGFSAILIEKSRMRSRPSFLHNVLEVLEEHGVIIEHMPSGIDMVSIVVSTKCLAGKENAIIAALKAAVNADSVEIEHGLALIAVVGRGMVQSRGCAARIFASIAHSWVNVRMIDQGASELNVVAGVMEGDFEKAVNAIYDSFFN